MLVEEKVEKIKSLTQEVCEREGCTLYDLEFVGAGRHRVLRIYIEGQADGQVSVEQCANVSRGLSLQLDVEDVIPGGQYELEVSSPGLERMLKQKWHYDKAVGKKVTLATLNPPSGHKGNQVKGQLKAVSDEAVVVDVNGTLVSVDFVNIKKAQTIFEFIKNEKKR
jgi:ribosome maturation factor RimP